MCVNQHMKTTEEPFTHLYLDARADVESTADMPDQYKHGISKQILI